MDRIKWAIGDVLILLFAGVLILKLCVPFLFSWFWPIITGSLLLVFLAIIGLNRLIKTMMDSGELQITDREPYDDDMLE